MEERLKDARLHSFAGWQLIIVTVLVIAENDSYICSIQWYPYVVLLSAIHNPAASSVAESP